tara:strand:- start:71 stop:268 length:198 start_codon:yes stop_codon:yes gene_type:complete
MIDPFDVKTNLDNAIKQALLKVGITAKYNTFKLQPKQRKIVARRKKSGRSVVLEKVDRCQNLVKK